MQPAFCTHVCGYCMYCLCLFFVSTQRNSICNYVCFISKFCISKPCLKCRDKSMMLCMHCKFEYNQVHLISRTVSTGQCPVSIPAYFLHFNLYLQAPCPIIFNALQEKVLLSQTDRPNILSALQFILPSKECVSNASFLQYFN